MWKTAFPMSGSPCQTPGVDSFIRYQATEPNARGRHPGIFALANGLAKSGALAPEDWAAWRAANDRGDAAYTDPSTVDPRVYDRDVNPGAHAWYKSSATHLFADLPFYVDLLSRHGVGVERLHSTNPGRVLYEDEVQVVVVPFGE
jgi:hypothetical protein